MDIAVIGMSGRFPGAENLNEFLELLKKGIDAVGKMPQNRAFRSSAEVPEFGYLKQINEFDHVFFGLSLSEAENMDPHQRLLLELVSEAVENAGYSFKELKGTKTAVILSAMGGPKPEYADLIEEYHPTFITGNAYAMAAGRISNFFGWTGPSMIIDTSCSSSLAALHEACNKLRLEEAELAISGGIRLLPNLEHKQKFEFVLEAGEGRRCRAFDSAADGIIGGEGGGIVLLKPLKKALLDRDSIHAVIKATAINQDGDRSNGLAAPSPLAQTEVIQEAWRKANIDPASIQYVEAHGTGTRLGDPIEVQGLVDAFSAYSDENHCCYIGSLKTNIGHLGEAAGIAGLIKTILSLKHGLLFPSLHFQNPNPHIGSLGLSIKVVDQLMKWPTTKDKKRRAGVSAFGLSGTNVHAVLEEAPSINEQSAQPPLPYLFTFSAKTEYSFEQNRKNYLQYISNSSPSELTSISYILNKGRNDWSLRTACVASSKEELLEKLSKASFAVTPMTSCSLTFLFSHRVSFSSPLLEALVDSHPKIKAAYHTIIGLENDLDSLNMQSFILQYLLYLFWSYSGITPQAVIGIGVGNLVLDVIAGSKTLEAAITDCKAFEMKDSIDPQRLEEYIIAKQKNQSVMYLSLCKEGDLLEQFYALQDKLENLLIKPSFHEEIYASLLEMQAFLYISGVPIDWDKHYEDRSQARIEIPTYVFESTPCWTAITPLQALGGDTSAISVSPAITESLPHDEGLILEDFIMHLWRETLKNDAIGPDDDFFDLGGNSLVSMHILEAIENKLQLKIDYDCIFEYSSVNSLAEYLRAQMPDEAQVMASEQSLSENKLSQSVEPYYPLSYAQEGIWYMQQLLPDSSFYNVPLSIRFYEPIDKDLVKQCIRALSLRHENLRTSFPIKNGIPSAYTHQSASYGFRYEDLSATKNEARLESLVEEARKEVVLAPFSMEMGPLLRVALFKLEAKKYELVLCMHHIITDEWSYQIFLNEFLSLYRQMGKNTSANLEPLAFSFREYAEAQKLRMKSNELEKQTAYWIHRLQNAPHLLELSFQKERPTAQSFKGASISFDIPHQVAANLVNISRRLDATLFMTLLAAWSTLLYRYSGQEDFVVGVPVAGRKITTEKIIGNFVNSIGLRLKLSTHLTFEQLVGFVRREALEGFKNMDVPFNLVVEKLKRERNLSYTPIYQYMFDFHQEVTKDQYLDFKLEFVPLELQVNSARCDMEMMMSSEDGALNGILFYNTDIFEKSDIQNFIHNFMHLLGQVAAKPTLPIMDIDLLGQDKPLTEDLIPAFFTDEFNF